MSDCCHSHPAETAESGASNHLAEDPVCGMSVEATPDAISLNYQKKTYYFCCGHCKDKFVEDPKQFLDPALKRSKKKPAAVKGAIYFCPMDPEVEQDHPGACPKCGMALEPMLLNPTHNDIGTNHEYVEMKCRFWLSAAFSIPLFALSMGRMENVLPSIDWYHLYL